MKKNSFVFTLIELLIVIAIIAILMTLLLPALTRAKRMAMRIDCANKLHQVNIAQYNFVDDHDGWLMKEGGHTIGCMIKYPTWQKLGLLLSNKYVKNKSDLECSDMDFSYVNGSFWRDRACGYSYLLPIQIPWFWNGAEYTIKYHKLIRDKFNVGSPVVQAKIKTNLACLISRGGEPGVMKNNAQYPHHAEGVNVSRLDGSGWFYVRGRKHAPTVHNMKWNSPLWNHLNEID